MSLTIRALALLLIALGCGSCAHITVSVVQPAPHLGTGKVLGGAAQTDITPPPGYAMGGHSIAGQWARGVWTRLQVRSMYIETASGARVALVAADLWSMPAGLADRIAELVAASPEKSCRLSREQLIIAATHTHQSPGNFSSSSLYNNLGSRAPGFDPDLFDFLALRIAATVRASCRNAEEVTLRLAHGEIAGLARNRSIEAFLRNPEADAFLAANANLPEGELSSDFPDRRAFHAIDPSLDVLWLLRHGRPDFVVGAAVFVAVHPTAMSHWTGVYSSDLLGIASSVAEHQLGQSSTGTPPVVAIFNGAEGDVSPMWSTQNRDTAVALGRDLGNRIALLRNAGRSIEARLDSEWAKLPLANACFIDQGGTKRCALARPTGGPAALGGAEDGRSVFYAWGCQEGVGFAHDDSGLIQNRVPTMACAAVYFGVRAAVFLMSAPETVTIGAYRLGPLVLVTLPGEFTTVMGTRVRDLVQSQFPPDSVQVVLIGLANEYVSYFTTPEEYAAQHYEGGSTLYGARSASLLAHYAQMIAGRLTTPTRNEQATGLSDYSVGLRRSFVPAELESINADELSKAFTLQFLGRQYAPTHWERFCWSGPAPGIREAQDRGWMMTPSVGVEQRGDNGSWTPLVIEGIPEDDTGVNLVTALAVSNGDQSTWCSFWIPTVADAARDNLSGRALRIFLVTQDGTTRVSPSFVLSSRNELRASRQRPERVGGCQSSQGFEACLDD